MLGLADKSAQRRLLGALLEGDASALLDLIDAQFALGVEPLALVRSAMDLVHRVTVAQIGKAPADSISAEDRAAIEQWAQMLTGGQLHRLWQLLLKGYDEVRAAPDPLIAAQMALLRVLHASDMPDPGTLAKKLDAATARGGIASASPAQGSAAAPSDPAMSAAADWTALVDRVEQAGQLRVAQVMRDWIRVIALGPERLHYALAPGYPGDPGAELRDALLRATGERWQVERGESDDAAPSLRESAEAERAGARAALLADPLVAATLAAFPGAEIIEDDAAKGGERDWRSRA
jgi:DNA polymerase-3 subunit gamma/tau